MSGRIVVFGEVMLRLSPPGRELLLQTPRLDVSLAGAEANVAIALAQLGHEVRIATALPRNPLGDHALRTLRGFGVDVSMVRRAPGRMGLYFVEAGAGIRQTEVHYDRAQSLFAETPAGDWPWDRLLEGADRLHLSGITPALGQNGTRVALAAADAAARLGVAVSFDGNYRARLWDAWAGTPRETLDRLVGRAEILFGNHRDVALLLGRPFSGDGSARRREAALAAFERYPGLRIIASTARRVESSDQHRLSARIDTPAEAFESEEVPVAAIVDRIGTGDAFAAGTLHGLRRRLPAAEAVRLGLSCALLKHTIPGDVLRIDEDRLSGLAAGGGDVRR